MPSIIKLRRGLKSTLDIRKNHNELNPYEPYYLTDTNEIAVATATNEYSIISGGGGGSSIIERGDDINSSITLTINNPAPKEIYGFLIKNTNTTSTYSVTLPAGNIYATQTNSILPNKIIELSFIYFPSETNKTELRIWQVSELLTGA